MPSPCEHLLEGPDLLEPEGALLGGTEAEDVLHDAAVVPGPVEEDDLPGRGELRDVALEVPLALLDLRGLGQRHDARAAGVQVLAQRLDRAALARRVPPLEDDQHPGPGLLCPGLEPHELHLERVHLLLVVAALHLLGIGVAGVEDVVLVRALDEAADLSGASSRK
jgi:hypothetical protein